jgi:amino acid transporter
MTVEVEPESPAKSQKIGLITAISYIIGVVGSGIFITPITVYRQTRSASFWVVERKALQVGISLLIWLFAGVVSTFGALSYVELGTTIQTSGADFSYMVHVEWYALAFAVIIVGSFINFPCIVAIQLQTFSEYLLQGLRVQGMQNEWVVRKLIEVVLLRKFLEQVQRAFSFNHIHQLLLVAQDCLQVQCCFD